MTGIFYTVQVANRSTTQPRKGFIGMPENAETKFARAIRIGQSGDNLSTYARRLRVSRQTLRDWMSGKRAPLMADLPEIARRIGAQVSDLVND